MNANRYLGRNRRAGYGGSRTYFRRNTEPATASEERSFASGNPPTLARLREIVDRSERGQSWSEITIIVGAFLLAASIIATLVLVVQINSRANQITKNADARAAAGVKTVQSFTTEANRIDDRLTNIEGSISRIQTDLSRLATSIPTTLPPGHTTTVITTTVPHASDQASTSTVPATQFPSFSPSLPIPRIIQPLLCSIPLLGTLLCGTGN